ncbi:hypothetical protein Q4488_15980 [Amphritea sp. 1_MG-2023]|nr:hypothetical protein [Amphritea sp. 1_MG-2023]
MAINAAVIGVVIFLPHRETNVAMGLGLAVMNLGFAIDAFMLLILTVAKRLMAPL